jgi:hypothetical protein
MTATLTLESPIVLGMEGSRMEHLQSGACSQKEGVDVNSSESKGDIFIIKIYKDRKRWARGKIEGVYVDLSESKGTYSLSKPKKTARVGSQSKRRCRCGLVRVKGWHIHY